MKNLLTVLIFSFILMGCGGLKKEVNRLTEEGKSKTELYEKKISELNTKISETESRETKSKTDLEIKVSEIATLKKERSQLQDTIDKKERTDFNVKNPTGPIKITDTKGNQYEFEGGQGTEISNTSESTLTRTIKSLKETVQEKTDRVQFLAQSLFKKDNIIKEKESVIANKNTEIKDYKNKTIALYENLQKQKTRTETPIIYWIGTGMGLMLLLQLGFKLLWKTYGGGIVERFKNGKIKF